MRITFAALLSALLIVTLAGCRDDNCIDLSGAASYCLLPAEQAPTVSLTQQVQLDWNEQRFTLLSVLEADQKNTTLVMLNPVGQTLFSVKQDAQGVTTKAAMKLPSGFDPKILLAMIQLALWPEQKIRAGLAPASCLRLEVAPDSRQLKCDGQPVLSVSYRNAQLTSYQLKWFSVPLQIEATAVNEAN